MGLFGGLRNQELKPYFFTDIIMKVCHKTMLKGSKAWSFTLPNRQLENF